MAKRQMQGMDDESDPPPVLRASLERQPAARAGWQTLTAGQTGVQLPSIFYYETQEARERRGAKAVGEALRTPERRASPERQRTQKTDAIKASR